MGTDDTMIRIMENPEEADKLLLISHVAKIKELRVDLEGAKDRITELERFQNPARWIFNKVAAGIGLAIAAATLGWLNLGG